MNSEKLTNEKRDRIVNMILQHRFGTLAPQKPDTTKDRAKLALDIYNDYYKDKLKAINDLPEGWLRKSHYIHVKLGAAVTSLNFSGGNDYYEYTKEAAFGLLAGASIPIGTYNRFLDMDISDITRKVLEVYDSNHDFSKRYTVIREKETKYKEEFNQLEAIARKTVASFSTTKQLIENWPEVEPFVVAVYTGQPKPSMSLAIPRTDLNEKFGLPVEEKKSN